MGSIDETEASILVTGATSQIGRCVLSRLLERRSRVIGVSRRQPNRGDGAGVVFFERDLSEDRLGVPRRLSSLVHIAAIWLLPGHLEELFDAGVRRLVCFSSTSIYVKENSSSPGERDLVRRTVGAEAAIRQGCDDLGIEWTILRPTLVYGLGIDRNISRAGRFIQRFGFYPLATRAEGLRQPVHADDLAAAALRALEAPVAAGKVYDIGGGERLAYREMIGRIFDVFGRKRRFVTIPYLEYAVAAAGVLMRKPEVTGEMVRRMRINLVCDNRVAAEDLDYQPRSFLSGGRADLGF